MWVPAVPAVRAFGARVLVDAMAKRVLTQPRARPESFTGANLLDRRLGIGRFRRPRHSG